MVLFEKPQRQLDKLVETNIQYLAECGKDQEIPAVLFVHMENGTSAVIPMYMAKDSNERREIAYAVGKEMRRRKLIVEYTLFCAESWALMLDKDKYPEGSPLPTPSKSKDRVECLIHEGCTKGGRKAFRMFDIHRSKAECTLEERKELSFGFDDDNQLGDNDLLDSFWKGYHEKV